MKRLTLLRHAKSQADSPTGRDFDRSLNPRGRADSKRLGQEIRDLGLTFDLVLASPARRAAETAAGVGRISPRFDERIYNASAGQLLEIVQSVDDAVERLMMVGHNPGFERLAARLTDGAVEEFPTATLVEIAIPVEHWREVGEGNGQLARFIKASALT